ncbi:energy-coupling factor transport system permease protein [Evansella caseinilytica]|uniref:Energy-coupling factor transport system permease protein n=1 Tax=Evansella caseinilytica TaxID=1503961 RepID=A0A1H3IQV1_9BACI|nr:energy-coupling factor transporter transmembrane component T [Evansella caseinilytica]SDY30090.1 energy-coupling factor transport system permease protein [Evansella caseinilytica]
MIQRFQAFHPAVCFFYYAGSVTVLMLLQHPVALLAALLLIVVINAVHDRCKGLRQWLVMIIVTGFFLLILNPLFNERGQHVLFVLFDHRITLEAVIKGGMSALTIIAVFAVFVSYNEVMTPNKLLYLFAKFFPQFAVLLMLTLRFIPLMKRRLADISAVQQSKGVYVSGGNWRERAKNGLLYVQVLLTYSLEEAIQTADSMKAREYGSSTRSTYEHFRMKGIDIIAFLLLGFFLAVSIAGRMQGHLYLTVYPVMDSLTLTGTETVYLTAFLIYLSFPLLAEGGGMIRWRLLK